MKKNIFEKYPKLIILIVMIILAYIIFQNQNIANFISSLDSLSYLGTFIAGMGYTFGFTSPLSTGFFLALHSKNILFIGILGGIGAMLADLFIFKFVKISFADEFHRLRKSRTSMKLKKMMRNRLNEKTKKILLYLFAGILIASPLPDEAGIIVLGGMTKISARLLAITSFVLNTTGIITILGLGNLI